MLTWITVTFIDICKSLLDNLLLVDIYE